MVYPTWFEGTWTVESTDLEDASTLDHLARFGTTSTSRGAVVGDRNFNARAIGSAVLGDQLLAVEQAPGQVNRQLARLSNDRQLETTVIGRRESPLDQPTFVSDELVLQILHGPGAPRISRIETLSRYERCDDGICAEQWQGRYSPPGEEITAAPLHVSHYRLTLKRQPDPTDQLCPYDRASFRGCIRGDQDLPHRRALRRRRNAATTPELPRRYPQAEGVTHQPGLPPRNPRLRSGWRASRAPWSTTRPCITGSAATV